MNDPRRNIDDVEALLRDLDPADLTPVAPPDDVWAGIDAAVRATAADTDMAPADAPIAEVIPMRRRWITPALLSAAAVAIAVVGAAVLFAGRTPTTVVATADLTYDAGQFDPLGAGSAARAELVESDDGFEIELDDATLPSVDSADLALWLIEQDDDGNIVDIAPVGQIRGDGTYAVPDGVDLTTHRLVDISIEPRDGDASHSGRSILRGSLSDV